MPHLLPRRLLLRGQLLGRFPLPSPLPCAMLLLLLLQCLGVGVVVVAVRGATPSAC